MIRNNDFNIKKKILIGKKVGEERRIKIQLNTHNSNTLPFSFINESGKIGYVNDMFFSDFKHRININVLKHFIDMPIRATVTDKNDHFIVNSVQYFITFSFPFSNSSHNDPELNLNQWTTESISITESTDDILKFFKHFYIVDEHILKRLIEDKKYQIGIRNILYKHLNDAIENNKISELSTQYFVEKRRNTYSITDPESGVIASRKIPNRKKEA